MTLERMFFRYLRLRGDVRAACRGPRALVTRYARRTLMRSVGRATRRYIR